ncbi:MAG: efflux RND transporter periplasmic adaptor subunit [Planctomycetota bacterium]|nr:efflux RND transporter periplasmic adaptor subunit [Planctomycetota bacterium]
MRRVARVAVWLLCIAAVAGGGAWGYRRYTTGGDSPKVEGGGKDWTTAKVERGPIRLAIQATGRVVSNLDVDIKCKASGEIAKLPFDVSDRVKKGDVLVELDPVDEMRAVRLAQVSLAASEARLAQAKANLTTAEAAIATDRSKAAAALKAAEARAERARTRAARLKKTTEERITTDEEYDAARAEAAVAEAELEAARVRLEEIRTQELALEARRQEVRLAESQVESDRIRLDDARQRLKDTTVVAPMDGVVAARYVQAGQIISSGVTNVGGGTTVLTLSDMSRIFVLGSVDESNIGVVEVGQKVVVTVDAHPGARFFGKVSRIATRGTNVSNVVTFEVKIEIVGGRKELLKPEMTANLEIVAIEKDDALLVPVGSVSRRQGKRYVEVLASGGEGGKSDGGGGKTAKAGPIEAAGRRAEAEGGRRKARGGAETGAGTWRKADVETPGETAGEPGKEATEIREVELGICDGARFEVISGLAEGERVIVRKGTADSKWRGDQRKMDPMRAMRIMGGGGRR